MAQTTKKGLLHELSRKGLTKRWEQKYFVLGGGVLKSFPSEGSHELKASIALDNAPVSRLSNDDREFAIQIGPTRDDHIYIVACASEEECVSWFEGLIAEAKTVVEMQGPLLKCDGSFKNWKKRHFVLTKRSLQYFKTAETKIPQAEIDLQSGADIIDDADVKGHKFAFTITPKDPDRNGKRRTYILVASSDKEREAWVVVLRQVVPTATLSRFAGLGTSSRSLTPSASPPSTPTSPSSGSFSSLSSSSSSSSSSATTLSVSEPGHERNSERAASEGPRTPTSAYLSAGSRSTPKLERSTSSAAGPSPPPLQHSASANSKLPRGRSGSIQAFASALASRLSGTRPVERTSQMAGTPSPIQIEAPRPSGNEIAVGFESSGDDDDADKESGGTSPRPVKPVELNLGKGAIGVLGEGVLQKRSPKKTMGMYIWKHRLIVLAQTSAGIQLKYFKPEAPNKPLGVIPGKLVQSVDILDAELQRFDIITAKRTFHMRGIEPGDMDLWVGWLNQVQIASRNRQMNAADLNDEKAEYQIRGLKGPKNIIHQGFLAKKSPKGLGLWQKRWFVVSEARLAYYKSEDTTVAPAGMILSSTLEQVTVLNEDQGHFCLIYGSGRRMELTIIRSLLSDGEGGQWNVSQKLEEQLKQWITAITSARPVTVDKDHQNANKSEEVVVIEDDDDLVAEEDRQVDAVRYRVVQELLSTERSYIKQLSTALEMYMKPMLEVGLLNDKTAGVLFSNLPTILPLNKIFLESLENRVQASVWKHNPRIGDIFLEFAPFFKLYSEYVRCNQAATELLGQLLSTNSKFIKYHDAASGSEKQSLASLLITPIQRVPRYQLLLKEVVKNTPEEHPDRADCVKALAAVAQLAAGVNSCIKERELADRVVALEAKFTSSPGFVDPSRWFIMQGPLTKYSRNDQPTLYEFFLFNDMLAYAALRADGKFKFKHKVSINEAFEVDGKAPDLTFSVQSQEKTFKVSAPDEAKKRLWVEKLEECAAVFKARKGPSDNGAKVRPLWRNNEDCRCCRKRFNLLLHRYHCATCGWSVCAKCSPTRQNDERCCNRCAAGYADGVAVEGFGPPEKPDMSRTKGGEEPSEVVDEGSDEDGLSQSDDDEEKWVNPFAVFAEREDDVDDHSSNTSDKRRHRKPHKTQNPGAETPDAKPLMSLTYFAYSNPPNASGRSPSPQGTRDSSPSIAPRNSSPSSSSAAPAAPPDSSSSSSSSSVPPDSSSSSSSSSVPPDSSSSSSSSSAPPNSSFAPPDSSSLSSAAPPDSSSSSSSAPPDSASSAPPDSSSAPPGSSSSSSPDSSSSSSPDSSSPPPPASSSSSSPDSSSAPPPSSSDSLSPLSAPASPTTSYASPSPTATVHLSPTPSDEIPPPPPDES